MKFRNFEPSMETASPCFFSNTNKANWGAQSNLQKILDNGLIPRIIAILRRLQFFIQASISKIPVVSSVIWGKEKEVYVRVMDSTALPTSPETH